MRPYQVSFRVNPVWDLQSVLTQSSGGSCVNYPSSSLTLPLLWGFEPNQFSACTHLFNLYINADEIS